MEAERFYKLLGHLEDITRLEDCVLVGSALLAAHRLRDVNDLDVLVTDADQLTGLARGAADRGWPVDIDPEGQRVTVTVDAGVIQASTEVSAFYAGATLTPMVIAVGRKRWASSMTESDYFYTMSLNHWRMLKRASGRDKDLDDLALAKDLK